jgi:multimeric flavodoxin WrbA
MNLQLKRTIEQLKPKTKVLLLTTSNRSPKSKDTPKSTQIAEYIQKKLGEDKCKLIDVASLKIIQCSGNVSEKDGNVCGVKDALLKSKTKNPSGYHRCWVSWAHDDDQLWKITKELFESDVVIFFGSVRWGQTNSIYQKLIERLNWIENRHTTLKEDNIIKDIEAGIILVGHNWNGINVLRTQKQVLKFYGFDVNDNLCWNWQYTRDELDETQEGYKRDPKVFEKVFEIANVLKESFISWLRYKKN